jgi:hypothetical protein
MEADIQLDKVLRAESERWNEYIDPHSDWCGTNV